MTINVKTPATTGIGSLPHHNIDAALAFSFQHDIPYLPQIPIRNPWEFMIAQATEGLPGLEVQAGGTVVLDLDVWLGRSKAMNERLLAAYAAEAKPEAFEAFEPSSATSSGWQPFLWELEERGSKIAKVQIAGPLTSQWSLRLKDGSSPDKHPEIATQIFRLVLARAIAMVRRLRSGGIQPVIYFDEPGLYGLTRSNPRHTLGLQELRVHVQALKKEGALVGLHCCSNTEWKPILELGLDILSIDTALSLDPLLSAPESEQFIRSGGRFSLGVIPTSKEGAGAPDVHSLFSALMDTFQRRWSGKTDLAKKAIGDAFLTPACGLAFQSAAEAEMILAALQEFRALCRGKGA